MRHVSNRSIFDKLNGIGKSAHSQGNSESRNSHTNQTASFSSKVKAFCNKVVEVLEPVCKAVSIVAAIVVGIRKIFSRANKSNVAYGA